MAEGRDSMVDIELQESRQNKDNRDTGSNSNSEKQQEKDNSKKTATAEKPRAPPVRDNATEITERRTEVAGSSGGVYASVNKRKTLGSFPPRPEFVYRPENTEAWMSCLRIGLIVFNLFIWVGDFGCCCLIV